MSSEQKKANQFAPGARRDDSTGELKGGDFAARAPVDPASAPRGDDENLRARLERERRRAVRAESRLAEIELALRRAMSANGGGGVPVGELRAVLDAVDLRLAALEDELKAGESELASLAEAQRRGGAVDADELKSSLEAARRDLDETARLDRGGLPELARQRMEFEVEMDRLQTLLSYRENVCDGLAEELQSGTRVTAEIIGRLADLSRGRVASARRPATVDARIATLRRDLEAEQTRLLQTRRALEAARAEANAARQAASDTERAAAERLSAAELDRLEREREQARRYAELEQSFAKARDEEDEVQRALQEEVARRHAVQLRLETLANENAALRDQVRLGDGERERELRERVAASETRFEEAEAERVRLAERLSLLEAALAAKEAAEKRREASSPVVDLRPRRRVLSLVHNRPATPAGQTADGGGEGSGAGAPPAEMLQEREREIDRLSQRWRELQEAYKGALSEFEDMRRKRDSLLLRMNPPSGSEPVPPAKKPAAPVEPAGAPPPPRAAVQQPLCLVQLDDEGERSDALRALTRGRSGIAYAWGRDPEVPPHVRPLLLLNLMAEDLDPVAQITALAGAGRTVDSFTYCARGARGFAIGPLEFFPAPFDPEVCAQRLLQGPQAVRRVLAVGEAIEALSSLREILGRARCSTAVAFDGSQALELAPLVRPNFVLVDLSLPGSDAVRALRSLRATPHGEDIAFGAMWSRPLDADKLRHSLAATVEESTLTPATLCDAVQTWLDGLGGRR